MKQQLELVFEDNTDVDWIMKGLEEINQLSTLVNKKLTDMINEIQKDWTEDEKEQINNPKEYYAKQKFITTQTRN